jgi:hypothetical protein
MKTIVMICFLLTNHYCSAQTVSGAPSAINADYLRISRTQKTAAWVLLGGGIVLATTGLSTALQDVYLFSLERDGSKYRKGSFMFYAGGAAMLGSIPLFIAGSKNKHRARKASASIKMESFSSIQQRSLVKNSYPALTLKISL